MSKEASDKPVAWRTKNQWNAWVATTSDIVATGWAESGRKVEPLYAHPASTFGIREGQK